MFTYHSETSYHSLSIKMLRWCLWQAFTVSYNPDPALLASCCCTDGVDWFCPSPLQFFLFYLTWWLHVQLQPVCFSFNLISEKAFMLFFIALWRVGGSPLAVENYCRIQRSLQLSVTVYAINGLTCSYRNGSDRSNVTLNWVLWRRFPFGRLYPVWVCGCMWGEVEVSQWMLGHRSAPHPQTPVQFGCLLMDAQVNRSRDDHLIVLVSCLKM